MKRTTPGEPKAWRRDYYKNSRCARLGSKIWEPENRNRKKIKLDKGLSAIQLDHGNAGDRRG